MPLALPEEVEGADLSRFASSTDYRRCLRLHRLHGTTYFFSTLLFPKEMRRRTHAVYAFVRTPDEWVDNPSSMDPEETRAKLQDYRRELLRGHDGVCPSSPVLRAFCDVMRESHIPLEEPLLFLDAMEQDLVISRYDTYESLRGYMRGSACAVGAMMCSIMDTPLDRDLLACAHSLGEAMQLTNFLRDVGEDSRRGRIYLPLEDLASFGVSESDILEGRVSDRFIRLMRFEMERARALYRLSDDGTARLPGRSRMAVKLARVLYSRILERIEELGYDVFRKRARTSGAEKVAVAAQVVLRG